MESLQPVAWALFILVAALAVLEHTDEPPQNGRR
jgi:hypothetical protein